MARNIIGIDIRSKEISAVWVKTALKGVWIEACAQIPISGFQEIEKGIAACLDTISESAALTGAVCITSFPGDQISFRNIQVPFKEKKKIRQILSYEIEPTLPLPVEDLVIDFFETGSDNNTELVTAAAEKSKLESLLIAFSAFKIEPKIITAGSYAMARCLTKINDIPGNYLFMDVDNSQCTLCLVGIGQVQFVRSFAIRANLPLKAGLLGTEIERTLNAFTEVSTKNFNPDIIFLTGYGLHNDTIKNELSLRLGLPVETPDLARAKGFSFKNSLMQQWNPGQMNNAVALTLIELEDIDVLDFRKGPFAVQKQWIKFKNEIVKTGILAGLVLVLLFLGMIFESISMKKRVDYLNNQIITIFKSTFPDVKKVVDPLQEMRIKLKSAQRRFAYPKETELGIRNIDILNDISKLIPANTDVELTRLVTGPEYVLISGNTDTFNSVNTIQNRLERGNLFEKVTITSANIDKSENRVRFKLKVQLPSSTNINREIKSKQNDRSA
jgi:Tfp pilus assembly PilM family ATPase